MHIAYILHAMNSYIEQPTPSAFITGANPNITHGAAPTIHDPFLPSFRGLNGRIGLVGGTFDPLTLAHLELGTEAKAIFDLDHVVYLPTHQNPLKKHGPLFTDEQRLSHLTGALENIPDFYVSPINLTPEGLTYTAETLRQIRSEIAEEAELYLLMGADCLKDLHLWKNYEEIFDLATIVPSSRDGFKETDIDQLEGLSDSQKKSLKVHFLEANNKISSSQIRAALEHGIIMDSALPDNVAQSIREWWPERYGNSPSTQSHLHGPK